MHKPTISDNHIKVVCRIRPLNELEKTQGGQVCLQFNSKSIKLKVNKKLFFFYMNQHYSYEYIESFDNIN